MHSRKGNSVELEVEHVQVNAKGIMSNVEFSTLDLNEKTAKVSKCASKTLAFYPHSVSQEISVVFPVGSALTALIASWIVNDLAVNY